MTSTADARTRTAAFPPRVAPGEAVAHPSAVAGAPRRSRVAALARRAGLAAILLATAAPAAAAAGDQGAGVPADPSAIRLDRLETAAEALEIQLAALGGTLPTRSEVERPRPGVTPAQGQLPQGYAAQVEVRLTQLERQISELTGQLERLRYEQGQIGNRLDRALSDIEYRLTVLEGGDPSAIPRSTGGGSGGGSTSGSLGGGAPGGLSPGRSDFGSTGATPPSGAAGLGTVSGGNTLGALSGSLTGSGGAASGGGGFTGQASNSAALGATQGATQSAALPAGDVMGQYDQAYGMLQRGDWAGAEQAFAGFVSQHGDHPLASNAQYWLGETYMARNQYDRAATAFARGYQRFPQGAKASDSLLKLGMALGEMGQTSDACLTFDRLLQDFPNATAATRRRVAELEARYQC